MNCAGDSDEISFQVDDVITAIQAIDDGWATGTIGGTTGMFPLGYVELVEERVKSPPKPSRSDSVTQPPMTPQPVAMTPQPVSLTPVDKGLCGVALYDYTAGLVFHNLLILFNQLFIFVVK